MTAIQRFDPDNTPVPRHISDMLRSLRYELMSVGDVESVVLFGSYTKGTYNKNSDIDIAVFVANSAADRLNDIYRHLSRCAADYPFDIQLLIFTVGALAEPVGIIEEIILYGRDITAL